MARTSSRSTAEALLRRLGSLAGARLEKRPRQVVQAVDGIDIKIAKGETFSLVGESGCGKSTVARLVVGLYPPTAGSIASTATTWRAGAAGPTRRRFAGACR